MASKTRVVKEPIRPYYLQDIVDFERDWTLCVHFGIVSIMHALNDFGVGAHALPLAEATALACAAALAGCRAVIHGGLSRDVDKSTPPTHLHAALDALRDESGRTLKQICDDRPTLVCLLRHNGCTFCRETIAELARRRNDIHRAGLDIAVVGMSESFSPPRALGNRFGLSDIAWIVDPDRLLYQALNIGRGSLPQLFGPRVVLSGLRGVLRGYGLGLPRGDPFQMPGTVIIHRGRVLRQYFHRTAADRPDYVAFSCELP